MSARLPMLVIAGAIATNVGAAPLFLQRLNAGPNAIENAAYGYGLDGDDTHLVAGEPFGLSGGSPAIHGGAVEVWRREGVTLAREQRILPPVPVPDGFFGIRTALSGDGLAVLDTSQGSQLHLYQRSGTSWSLQQTLAPGPDDGGWGGAFGLLDDCLVIGSPGYTPGTGLDSSGAVHRFRRQGTVWSEQPMLTGLDAAQNRAFGDSVALDRRADGVLQLAVGASGRNQGNGAVYVFHGDGAGWAQEQRLQLSDAQVDERLGKSVALRGGTLVSGAPQATVAGQSLAGRAVVWRRRGNTDFPWVQEARLALSAPASDDKFGFAVALPREDEVLVSAPYRAVGTAPVYSNAGLVRAFVRSSRSNACASPWNDAGGVGNPGALPQSDALYGATLFAHGDLAAIGAIGGSVQSIPATGFVEALREDVLFADPFDCGL
jgi:hypothetical protein